MISLNLINHVLFVDLAAFVMPIRRFYVYPKGLIALKQIERTTNFLVFYWIQVVAKRKVSGVYVNPTVTVKKALSCRLSSIRQYVGVTISHGLGLFDVLITTFSFVYNGFGLIAEIGQRSLYTTSTGNAHFCCYENVCIVKATPGAVSVIIIGTIITSRIKMVIVIPNKCIQNPIRKYT